MGKLEGKWTESALASGLRQLGEVPVFSIGPNNGGHKVFHCVRHHARVDLYSSKGSAITVGQDADWLKEKLEEAVHAEWKQERATMMRDAEAATVERNQQRETKVRETAAAAEKLQLQEAAAAAAKAEWQKLAATKAVAAERRKWAATEAVAALDEAVSAKAQMGKLMEQRKAIMIETETRRQEASAMAAKASTDRATAEAEEEQSQKDHAAAEAARARTSKMSAQARSAEGTRSDGQKLSAFALARSNTRSVKPIGEGRLARKKKRRRGLAEAATAATALATGQQAMEAQQAAFATQVAAHSDAAGTPGFNPGVAATAITATYSDPGARSAHKRVVEVITTAQGLTKSGPILPRGTPWSTRGTPWSTRLRDKPVTILHSW